MMSAHQSPYLRDSGLAVSVASLPRQPLPLKYFRTCPDRNIPCAIPNLRPLPRLCARLPRTVCWPIGWRLLARLSRTRPRTAARTPRHLPTTWNEKENVRWKTGDSREGMVVAGGTRQAGLGDNRRRGTGRQRSRRRKVLPPANPVKEVSLLRGLHRPRDRQSASRHQARHRAEPAYCHPFNSYASPTPFIEEGRLYAHFGSHGTWCVDTDTGKVLWERTRPQVRSLPRPGVVADRLRRPALPHLRRLRPAVRRGARQDDRQDRVEDGSEHQVLAPTTATTRRPTPRRRSST